METSAPKKQRFQKLRIWKKQHPQKFWILVSLLVLLIGIIGFWVATLLQPTATLPKATPTTPKKPAPTYYSPLTGAKVSDEKLTKRPVTAIMIENSTTPGVRPQSGLKQAGIIYEAIAEGGITRFLALYQEATPQLIGPVRSVRMYYVDWAAPYNASIAHVGGSAAALAEVRGGNYRDIDQFFNDDYYWRATDKAAPHNVFTSFEKLDALNAAKGYTTSTFTPWPRHDGKPSAAPNATSIDMVISSPGYNPHYDYDKASNTYLRSIGGEESSDREEGRLAPSVVVAPKVDMSLVMEDGYRESITTTGEGVADIFQNGIVTEATWRKSGRSAPLQFFDASGKEIALNRGQTWISAIPNGSGSVSWQ